MIRELRGYSQEFMAQRLGIAQNSYSRIENNQTKLSTEMLEQVSKELGVSPMDIISGEPTVVNFYGANHGGTQGTFGHVEQYTPYHQEIIDKLLEAKDGEIERLQKLVESLLAKK